jgi:hypothetical protein
VTEEPFGWVLDVLEGSKFRPAVEGMHKARKKLGGGFEANNGIIN